MPRYYVVKKKGSSKASVRPHSVELVEEIADGNVEVVRRFHAENDAAAKALVGESAPARKPTKAAKASTKRARPSKPRSKKAAKSDDSGDKEQ